MDCRFRPFLFHNAARLFASVMLLICGASVLGQSAEDWRGAPELLIDFMLPFDSLKNMDHLSCTIVGATGKGRSDSTVIAHWNWDPDSLRVFTHGKRRRMRPGEPFGTAGPLPFSKGVYYAREGDTDSTVSQWTTKSPPEHWMTKVRATHTWQSHPDSNTTVVHFKTRNILHTPSEQDSITEIIVRHNRMVTHQSHPDSLRRTWVEADTSFIWIRVNGQTDPASPTFSLSQDSALVNYAITDQLGRDSIRVHCVTDQAGNTLPQTPFFLYYDSQGRLKQVAPFRQRYDTPSAFLEACLTYDGDPHNTRYFSHFSYLPDGHVLEAKGGYNTPAGTLEYDEQGRLISIVQPRQAIPNGYFNRYSHYYNFQDTLTSTRVTLREDQFLTITYDHHHRPTSMTWTQGDKNKVVDWVRFWWQD